MLTIMMRHAHSWEPACLGLSPSSSSSSSVSLGMFYKYLCALVSSFENQE